MNNAVLMSNAVGFSVAIQDQTKITLLIYRKFKSENGLIAHP